jgi:hypothetical protein
MTRKKLDLIFSIGGVLLALLIVVLGLVLRNQSNFAKSYVRDQMSAQQISFTPAAGLSDEEKAASCLVKNAGKPLTTGKQAECYANEYIGLHVREINGGKTYSQTSGESRAARGAAEKALAADPDAQASKDLDAAAKTLAGKTDTLFKGETLRGLLLTSYGFSIFGERAGQAASIAFLAALVLLAASLAGFVHSRRKDADHLIIPQPSPVPTTVLA